MSPRGAAESWKAGQSRDLEAENRKLLHTQLISSSWTVVRPPDSVPGNPEKSLEAPAGEEGAERRSIQTSEVQTNLAV